MYDVCFRWFGLNKKRSTAEYCDRSDCTNVGPAESVPKV